MRHCAGELREGTWNWGGWRASVAWYCIDPVAEKSEKSVNSSGKCKIDVTRRKKIGLGTSSRQSGQAGETSRCVSRGGALVEFIQRSQRLRSQGCSGAAFIKGTALILSLDEPKIYCSCYLTLESSTYSSLNFNRTTDLFPILFFNPFPRIDPTRALPLRRCHKQLVAEHARVWISACVLCHAALPSLPAAGASLPGLSRKQDGLALRHIRVRGCLPHLAARNTQIKCGLSQTWPILLKKSSMKSPEARPCFGARGKLI